MSYKNIDSTAGGPLQMVPNIPLDESDVYSKMSKLTSTVVNAGYVKTLCEMICS